MKVLLEVMIIARQIGDPISSEIPPAVSSETLPLPSDIPRGLRLIDLGGLSGSLFRLNLGGFPLDLGG